MRRLIDISPVVSDRIAVWPGDVPFRREVSMDVAKGDHLGLSSIRTTLHLGAHADAPVHFAAGGAGAGELPLERFYGRCRVVDLSIGAGRRILPADLPAEVARSDERLLLRTGSYPDPDAWNDDFASLSVELVDHLADLGFVLVGIDTPSVDPMSSKELEAHHALLARGLSHLEGLVLAHVEPGVYTLSAFPLRLEGADASPVRAVLVDER